MGAFVAMLDDGSALTWGDPTHGGEISHIQSSDGAFAAILADGSAVAWGKTEFGGDCSDIQAQLTGL